MKKDKYKPYCEPDYACEKPEHGHSVPPDNRHYPDPRIYGAYASKELPRYVPHSYEHICFKPRKEDYKPPMSCDGGGESGLCSRRNQRLLTVDQQNRFLNAFTQINAVNALGTSG